MWSCLLELQPRDTFLEVLRSSLRHESRPLAFVSAPLAPLVFPRHGNQHAHRVRDPSKKVLEVFSKHILKFSLSLLPQAALKRLRSVKRNLYEAIKPHVDELLVQK
ncbi:hypothetical protein Q7C36_008301 [Tachysurus vachellii]|uniref:Uncharacterized protein n=1 Tax=Tachysurus vachellii TaxID=175792 RepID=A0AA88NGB1_TACVA|nr:hypothetical protein Q7C36_008301 [Tachysurus vachellii]